MTRYLRPLFFFIVAQFSVKLLASPLVIPGDRLEVVQVDLAAPDCEALIFGNYKLVIKGTRIAMPITEDEKTVLELLIASDQPLTDLGIENAKLIVRRLNAKSMHRFGHTLIIQKAGTYSLQRPQTMPPTELETAVESTPQTKRKQKSKAQEKIGRTSSEFSYTTKENLLIELVMSSRNQTMSFEHLAAEMEWPTPNASRRINEYLRSINRHFLIRYGIPLFESGREFGVRVYRGKRPAISHQPVLQETRLGNLYLSGNALLLSNVVNLKDRPTEAKTLQIESKEFESMALSEEELLDALAEINSQAQDIFGEPLVRVLNIEVWFYRSQFTWNHKFKRFKSKIGWHPKSLNQAPDSI